MRGRGREEVILGFPILLQMTNEGFMGEIFVSSDNSVHSTATLCNFVALPTKEVKRPVDHVLTDLLNHFTVPNSSTDILVANKRTSG